MSSRWALAVAAAVLASGCLAALQEPAAPASTATELTKVRDRAALPFAIGDEFSRVLAAGAFTIRDAVPFEISFAVPVGNGLPEQTIHMAVFLPEIPGCDFAAATVASECRVPVIADVGPYYGDGDVHATVPAERLGRFLIENFVPHGYAVAQVSVSGTGDSVGCMDLMGEVEQAGVQAAVDFLGTASWSSGSVGLIGRSYDGSTPWEAAMSGSPYLKTVVPISGLYGQYDLMFPNGSAEFRGPGLLWGIYYIDGFSGNDGNPTLQAQQAASAVVCPESTGGGALHVGTYAHPDKAPTPASTYWLERDFREEVLANYEGSVYFIHGMRDWNVDPHMAFPFYNQLEAKGLETKGLFGQWQHMYPDRASEHEGCDECPSATSVRYDWAQDLLEWFDHYLKGTGPKPELHVEMQDDLGAWRIEATWPPADLAWSERSLAELAIDGPAVVQPGSTAHPALGLVDSPVGSPGVVELTLAAQERDMRIAGLPQLHMSVTPLGSGGQIYAELVDADDGRQLAHGILDLRFAAGGTSASPVVPGQTMMAYLQMQPADTVLPAGHRLVLRLAATGMDYLPPSTGSAVEIDLDGSTLRLPLVERASEAFFQPPGTA